MKRLILFLIMFFSVCLPAQDDGSDNSDDSSTEQTDNQDNSQSSDQESNTSQAGTAVDESSIMVKNIHQISLDTTDVDGSGNWLNKRIWYERAQIIFDQIHSVITGVADLRVQFSNEVNAIGHKIDSFYETVYFSKGELDEKFKDILTALDAQQKLMGDLSEQERTLQASIKKEQPIIDQIGKDIKSIGDIDNKIDDTLKQAFKTIDECRDYENKSWDSFKSIAKELDDKKARTLYYQMSNHKQNIDQKITYLKSTLFPYLQNTLVAKIESNISKINQAVEDLKTKGIDLEKIMSTSQDADITLLHTREKEAEEIAAKNAVEKEQVEEEKRAKEAAQKAEEALEKERKKSFSYVMTLYYQETFGKLFGFMQEGFVYLGNITGLSYIAKQYTSLGYPVFTYVRNGLIDAKIYMSSLVESIMIYFGTNSSSIKNNIKEKIKNVEEKVEHAQGSIKEKIEDKIEHSPVAEKIEALKSTMQSHEQASSGPLEHIKEKIEEKIEERTGHGPGSRNEPQPQVKTESEKGESVQNNQPAKAPTGEGKPGDHQVSAQPSATPATPPAPAQAQSAQDDTKVVVQSIQNNDTNTKHRSVSLYTVFSSILNVIGTILMSIYNCIVQCFKLIFNFSAYVMS